MSEIERYDCEEDRSCEYEVKAVMQVNSTGHYVRHADHFAYLNEMRLDRDAQRLRADTAEAELADMQRWRDLALQFDNHRMTALGHLRAVVRCSDRDLLTNAEEFLKAPPLAAHEVVAKLAAAEQRIAVLKSALEGMLEYFPEGHSDGECFSVEAARAALNQKSECCTVSPEEQALLDSGDYRPEELFGIGGKPSCPKCFNQKSEGESQ